MNAKKEQRKFDEINRTLRDTELIIGGDPEHRSLKFEGPYDEYLDGYKYRIEYRLVVEIKIKDD